MDRLCRLWIRTVPEVFQAVGARFQRCSKLCIVLSDLIFPSVPFYILANKRRATDNPMAVLFFVRDKKAKS
ncbi:hypothetical protein D3C87_2126430 [compost metagenome]